ncbi:MAG: DUF1549 and DUF1553 domain-containing protein [Bryobacteraceae bacterium]
MHIGRLPVATPIAGFILLTGLALTSAAGPATESVPPKSFTVAQKRWWAFQPVAPVSVPAVRKTGWGRNEIDRFVLAKLEANGLAPNPEADRRTLLRRASLDLIGLPPTPEEMQAFLADTSPEAWEKAVDRLLASKHYGERWARHWLDLARYADSEGFKSDETRPNVWRYRDYVIESFNADKPYDRFVQEQIAGDEMFANDPQALVATGFNRHFPDESNARNLMQRRQELLNDITDVVGQTFMAMTVGCARCHDHKFDPILQKDYYRLQAFFANTRIDDHAALVSPEAKAEYARKQAVWEEKTRSIRDNMRVLVEPKQKAMWKEGFDKFPPEIQDAIITPPDKRTPIQWHMYYKGRPQVEFSVEAAAKKLKGDEAKRYKELARELAAFDSIKPAALPLAQAMVDNGVESPKTHVLSVGVYDAYKEEVQPGFLTILDAGDAVVAAGANTSGRRAALAKWLTKADNPLTYRVMVNRVWHYHFGRGISGTPSDFGVMGERPSHRELLDWLTAQFAADGYSLKKLHKRLLLSATWRQSSDFRAEAAKADPDNKLLWRFNRRRLEGEIIRDSMLSVAGMLNTKMYGRGVFPPMPPGVITRGGWQTEEDESESLRRSVYTFVRRNTRYPMFETFDMPDTHESCARRSLTVSPNQALDLLNNELVVGWAQALARRVSNDAGVSAEGQVERAYRFTYGRSPDAGELAAGSSFLARQSALAGGRDAALVDLCHMLLNSNEFVYLN